MTHAKQRAQEPRILNGLNLDALFDTLDAIRKKPEIAKFQFRARNKWESGGLNSTTISDFDGACQLMPHAQPFTFIADEPPVLLGTDQGANPVEYLLTALAGCVTTSIVVHAAAKGIQIEQMECRLEGDIDLRGFLGLDKSVRNGYQAIRMIYKIKANCPDDKLEEVLQLGPTYSPVYDVVSRSVPVSVDLDR